MFKAMGMKDELAYGSIRFHWERMNTLEGQVCCGEG